MPTRRTKIVATLGPSSNSRAEIEQLVRVGMDVARMNFSHGSHAEHAARIATVRAASQACGRSVGVLLDLQGPKIRTGTLRGGAAVEIPTGGRFVLTTRPVDGDTEQVTTSYEPLPTDVEPGDRIFLSDGSIALRAIETTATDVVTEVVYGGTLKERQGINLPGVRISAAGVTEKDVRDLAFGLEQEVDYVAISFVRSADDVLLVKRLVTEHGRDTPVIAKLEKPEAIEALPAILDVADGVMVARGDLGVELSPEKVPLVQKRIIEEANRRAKPVITATQMLESMVSSPRPTRAEASDVANAILDGSDAVMLSAETAMGRYPVESIETMARIAEEIEAGSRSNRDAAADHSFVGARSAPEAIGAAVDAVIDALPEVSSVWVFTQSGSTARLIAHHRPRIPVIAFTPSESCYRRLSLVWGITPILTETVSNFRDLSDRVFPLALQHEIAERGDTVVVTGSHPFDSAAPTNFLKLHTV